MNRFFCFWKSVVVKSSLLLLCVLFALLLPATVNAEKIVGLLAGAGGLGDQSYNDMTFAGLGKAQRKYNFKILVEETQSTIESQEAGLKSLLLQGADVIVANGSGLEKLVRTYSPHYPDKFFLVNDSIIEDHANVTSTVFAHQEGSYLAGMLAASLTKSGSIGFIGGVDLPIIQKFLNGYRQGARSVSSTVKITNAFVSSGGDLSGFTDPARGLVMATEMYTQGADIIFSVAGLTGNGVIRAAQQQEKFVIGVDANQDHMAKGYVLTSMMKRLDTATFAEIGKIMEGKFEPGAKYYGLSNGGVSLTPMTYTRHLVPDLVMDLLQKTERDLISGKLTIAPVKTPTDKADMTLGFLVGISGLGDQSFNDAAYAGLFRVKQEHNLKLIIEDSEKSDMAFEDSMQRLIDKGSNIIVANGFYLKDLVEKYAKQYPGRFFILQDAPLGNLPNVVSILYSVHEGSFLAGALAGMMTTTGKVGFIGGVDIPIMHVFRLGFREGVLYTNPSADIWEEFVSEAPDYSGFKQPAKGYEMAMSAFEADVDIVFAAAGLTGNGIIQAARKAGRFAIGVDSDQDYLAKGSVLTSMLKRLDIATYSEVNKIVTNQFVPGIIHYGLRQNGVGLSQMKFTRHLVSKEKFDRLADIEAQIIDGSINVSNYLEIAQPGPTIGGAQ